MTSKQELLESLNIIYLAVLCGKVAESTPDENVADEAWNLKRAWALLVAQEPGADFKTHQKIQDGHAELKKRMAEFLARNL